MWTSKNSHKSGWLNIHSLLLEHISGTACVILKLPCWSSAGCCVAVAPTECCLHLVYIRMYVVCVSSVHLSLLLCSFHKYDIRCLSCCCVTECTSDKLLLCGSCNLCVNNQPLTMMMPLVTAPACVQKAHIVLMELCLTYVSFIVLLYRMSREVFSHFYCTAWNADAV